jgi:membrane-associated phospholipid phosphatase
MKLRDKRLWEWMSLSLLLGLAAAIGSLVFFAWLSDEVLEGETRSFDEATRSAVHAWASPPLTTFMQAISFMGSTEFLFGATTVATLLMIRSKWKREAILFPITMIGAGLLNTTLKLSFQRTRPVPFFDLLAPRSYSFPSGHALASFCFYAVLAAMLAARTKNRKWVRVFWVTAAVVVLLIGLSRIYLGVHYTTDVLAGYSAALIWVLVVNFVEQRLAARRRKRQLNVR